jgi:hypothetical protein
MLSQLNQVEEDEKNHEKNMECNDNDYLMVVRSDRRRLLVRFVGKVGEVLYVNEKNNYIIFE